MAERKGRQTPTCAVVLSYSETHGQKAVELYNKTGRTAQEWQELLLYDIMAVNSDGLWTHTKFGYSVPRRNGKNEVLVMREMYAFTHSERVMHTAHRTTTSHAAWERLVRALSNVGYIEGQDFRTHKQFGLESIEWLDGRNDGIVVFRTRSSKGGLGEGYDLLIIDEAQEYTDDQESALKYIVTDSKNPQTIMCGTPPTPVSSGTVFLNYRLDCLAGKKQNSGWAEWSVPYKSEVHDVELWYETNPSLGTVLTERNIADEIGSDEDDFNIQRLGLWVMHNLKSAISLNDWKALECDKVPELQKMLFAGIKYSHDGTNVSISVAIKTQKKQVFVEAIDCQPARNGTAWIIDWLQAMRPSRIVIDGASGQNLLAAELKAKHIKGVELPTVKDVIAANALFEQAVFGDAIRHCRQPSLEQAVSNCEKRMIGSNGGFGYRAQKANIEIALLDSTILAYWICSKSKERRKQKISY